MANRLNPCNGTYDYVIMQIAHYRRLIEVEGVAWTRPQQFGALPSAVADP